MINQEVFHVNQRVKFVGPPDHNETGIVVRIEGNKLKVQPDDPLKKWNLRSKDHFTAAFIENISSAATTSVPPPPPTSPSVVEGIDRNWNSSKDIYFPPCFTNKSVKEIPKIDASTGTVEWNGKSFTTAEWSRQLIVWETSFPNIKDPITKSTRWEKPGVKHTTSVVNIDYCWSNLDQRVLPSRWKDIFRIDMWGNVVSKLASNNSLTKFDVDHAFPWSRGGRSVEANFVGCHHAANRLEKNDKLLQSLDPIRMNLGIRADQFVALFAYAESRAPPNRRLDKQWERDRVQAWLLRSPRNGEQISNFQLEVQHAIDGEAIYLFLEQHFEPRSSIAVPPPAPTTLPAPTSSLLATVADIPAVFIRYNTTGVPGEIRIEAFGPGTYTLKDMLKPAPYAMIWAGNKTQQKKSDYWFKTVKSVEERDAFRQICHDLCQSNGMQLVPVPAMVR